MRIHHPNPDHDGTLRLAGHELKFTGGVAHTDTDLGAPLRAWLEERGYRTTTDQAPADPAEESVDEVDPVEDEHPDLA